jgi:hypothetical protein
MTDVVNPRRAEHRLGSLAQDMGLTDDVIPVTFRHSDRFEEMRRWVGKAAAHASAAAVLRDAAAELDEAGDRHAAQVLRRLADQKEQQK